MNSSEVVPWMIFKISCSRGHIIILLDRPWVPLLARALRLAYNVINKGIFRFYRENTRKRDISEPVSFQWEKNNNKIQKERLCQESQLMHFSFLIRRKTQIHIIDPILFHWAKKRKKQTNNGICEIFTGTTSRL